MKTPNLETERLLLRPFQEMDGEEVFKCWESDPDVANYMFWSSHNEVAKSMAWTKMEVDKIESDDWYRFAFVEKATGCLIGTGLIYYEEEVSNWEIAYNLGKKYWGQGFATEAMKKIIQYAKLELGIKEIVGRHASENSASEQVMIKLGFQYSKDIPYECNNGRKILDGKQYILYL